MKKKKSGSVAIPFLLTFLIALIIIGGIAMIIYDKIDSDNSSLLTMTNEAATLSDSDSHTILLVLDLSDTIDSTSDDEEIDESSDDESSDEDSEEETYDWEVTDEEEEEISDEPYTFILMRSMPAHKQIVYIGLPDNMIAGEQNKSLTEIYKSGGGAELAAAAGYSLDITVDRYISFDSDSFQKLCNVLGGVNFAVPTNINGIKESDGLQYLSPEQIESVIRYGGFSGGEIQRVSTAASLITAMTNQTSGSRIADNLDNTFDTLVNSTDTNVSALDYEEEKYAIKFMMKYSDSADEAASSRAKFLTPSGTQTTDTFVIDASFIDEISQYFVVETTSSQEETTLQPMLPETESETDVQ